jgi:DNA repair protein RadC
MAPEAQREKVGSGGTIRDLPAEERPRERLLQHGASALTTPELIAILLRTGRKGETAIEIGERLLRDYGGLEGLAATSPTELERVTGIGTAKAVQLAAAFELWKRLDAVRSLEKETIHEAADAVPHVRRLIDDYLREHVVVLALNQRHRIRKAYRVSVGSVDSSLADPREVFTEALRAKASAIFVAHNHPSGDLTPSPEDLRTTRRLVEAGNLLGIRVLDHILITPSDWASIMHNGASR